MPPPHLEPPGKSPTVQTLEPSQYPAASALLAAAYPARAGEPSQWAEEERIDGVGRRAVIDGDPERVEADGAIWRVQADRFRMDLSVDGDRLRCGIGSHLLADLLARAREAGAATLQARAEADAGSNSGNPAMIRILEKIGYRWVSAEVRLVRRLDQRDLC